MKLSRGGLLLIKSFEGFRRRAVRRRDGALVIGYGHTRSAREGATVTEAEAELLLIHDLTPAVAVVSEIKAPLNRHQFDALVSFVHSVGVERFRTSDVLERLNAGAVDQAAEALSGWPDRTPPPPDSLYRRRSAERALFDADPSRPATLAALMTAPVRSPARPAAQAAPEAEPEPETVQVLRHERSPAPHRSGTDTAAFLFMGGVGVLSFGGAMAAIRRSVEQAGGGLDTAIIGVVLALIGVILVVVSGWNLYRGRAGR